MDGLCDVHCLFVVMSGVFIVMSGVFIVMSGVLCLVCSLCLARL